MSIWVAISAGVMKFEERKKKAVRIQKQSTVGRYSRKYGKNELKFYISSEIKFYTYKVLVSNRNTCVCQTIVIFGLMIEASNLDSSSGVR